MTPAVWRAGGEGGRWTAAAWRRALALASAAVLLGGCSSWQKWLEEARGGDESLRPYANLLGTRWQLQAAVIRSGTVAVPHPERYTIEFRTDHRLAVTADCNRGLAAWSANGAEMKISRLSLSQDACPVPSLGEAFVDALGRVDSWYLAAGALFLEQPGDGRVLRFSLLSRTPP